MRNLPEGIDEVTPKGARGGVVLSPWAWAAHRYTMAALLLLLASIIGVAAHDYLQMRARVIEMDRNKSDIAFQHESRITSLEDKRDDILSMILSVSKDVREMNNALNNLIREVEIVKTRLPEKCPCLPP